MHTQRRPSHADFDIQDEAILHSVRAAELVLLAAMRAWTRPYCGATNSVLEWRDVLFSAAIDTAGTTRFETLMRAWRHGAARGLDLRCRCCKVLGADEAAMLDVLALLQRGRYIDAVRCLAARTPLDAVEALARSAWRVAESFADAGLIIAQTEREVAYVH